MQCTYYDPRSVCLESSICLSRSSSARAKAGIPWSAFNAYPHGSQKTRMGSCEATMELDCSCPQSGNSDYDLAWFAY